MSENINSREFVIESLNKYKVKKNWRFYTMPKIILILLLIDLAWEITRLYMDMQILPWKISLLGVNTTGTLCGVFASLLFAREQFARTVKPNLSWSTHFDNVSGIKDKIWVINLMNAGPGTAVIESIWFSYELVSDELEHSNGKSASISELIEVLSDFGLKEGQDFYCKLITKGFPLPPVKKHDEGIVCLAIKTKSFYQIKSLDIHVAVSDIVGDIHFKSLPIMSTLPKNFNEIGSINNLIINLTE